LSSTIEWRSRAQSLITDNQKPSEYGPYLNWTSFKTLNNIATLYKIKLLLKVT